MSSGRGANSVPAGGPEREAPLLREPLAPLVWRRASLAYYRRSARYSKHVQIVGPGNSTAVPRFAEVLAVQLCERLPASITARLGPERALRIAERVCAAGALVKRVVWFLLWPVRVLRRSLRRRREASAKRRRERLLRAAHFAAKPPVSNVGLTLDGRVALEGFTVEENRARLFFRRRGEVEGPCQVFMHLYPEREEVLPPERRGQGYFCKDHYPAVEVRKWTTKGVFKDEVALADLPPGFYRVEVGLIEVKSLRKFPVDGTGRLSVDLGWLRIAPESRNGVAE